MEYFTYGVIAVLEALLNDPEKADTQGRKLAKLIVNVLSITVPAVILIVIFMKEHM